MKQEIKWIIIEALNITPREFESRFEGDNIELSDAGIKCIAEKCYEEGKRVFIIPTNWSTPSTPIIPPYRSTKFGNPEYKPPYTITF